MRAGFEISQLDINWPVPGWEKGWEFLWTNSTWREIYCSIAFENSVLLGATAKSGWEYLSYGHMYA